MLKNQQQETEQMESWESSAPIEKDRGQKNSESVDFKKLEARRQKDEHKEKQVMSDIGKIKQKKYSSLPSVSIKDIEQVLSGGLEEAYFNMAPEIQQKFKQKGEETARKIKEILGKARFNVKKITKLIMNWLKIIPGANMFFLEQESKIKTDEILKLNSHKT